MTKGNRKIDQTLENGSVYLLILHGATDPVLPALYSYTAY